MWQQKQKYHVWTHLGPPFLLFSPSAISVLPLSLPPLADAGNADNKYRSLNQRYGAETPFFPSPFLFPRRTSPLSMVAKWNGKIKNPRNRQRIIAGDAFPSSFFFFFFPLREFFFSPVRSRPPRWLQFNAVYERRGHEVLSPSFLPLPFFFLLRVSPSPVATCSPATRIKKSYAGDQPAAFSFFPSFPLFFSRKNWTNGA